MRKFIFALFLAVAVAQVSAKPTLLLFQRLLPLETQLTLVNAELRTVIFPNSLRAVYLRSRHAELQNEINALTATTTPVATTTTPVATTTTAATTMPEATTTPAATTTSVAQQ